MTRRIIKMVTAAAIVLLSGCVTTPQTHTAAEIYDVVSPAVVAVATPTSLGSGVSLSGGWIVTNAHVVWPYSQVMVRFPGEEGVAVPVAYADLTADLALLGPVTDVPVLDLSPVDLPVSGADVFLVGYPATTDVVPHPSISAGIVSRTRLWESTELTYIQTDTASSPGQSGGILVDTSARIIGLSGHVLGANDFALSLSASDLLTRIRRMENDPPMSEVLEARRFEPTASREHDAVLEHEWDLLEFGILDGDSSVEVSVQTDGDVEVSLIDSYGYYVEYVDERVEGDEILRAGYLGDGPHYVIVACWDSGGPVHIDSSANLYRRRDPDDGAIIDPGASIAGVIDHPNDIDYFYVDLTEGSTIRVVVESIMMDPYIYLDDLSLTYYLEDDDSGGGLLGLDSVLTVRATSAGRYLLAVTDCQGWGSGGYTVRTEAVDDPGAHAVAYPAAPMLSPTEEADYYGPVDPQDDGGWAYFADRPEGWVADTEFFAGFVEGALGPSVFRFGGGVPDPFGYDPYVMVMAFPAPGFMTLGSMVDGAVGGIEASGDTLDSRRPVNVGGWQGEEIRANSDGLFLSQTYFHIDSTIWIVSFIASTEKLLDKSLALLDSFDPDLAPSAEAMRQVDPRQQFQMELAGELAKLAPDDASGAVAVLIPYRDRAVESFGLDDEITVGVQLHLATLYFTHLNQYDDAVAVLSQAADVTPLDVSLQERLAWLLNNIAWQERNDGDPEVLLHFAERAAALRRSINGAYAPATLGNEHTLAVVQHTTGDTPGAIATLERVVRVYEQEHGVDRDLVGFWADLAHFYELVGSTQNAEELVEWVVKSGMDPPAWTIGGMPARLQLNDQEALDGLYLQIMDEIEFGVTPYPQEIPEGASAYYGEYTCAQGLAGSVTVILRSGGDITCIALNGGPRSRGELGSVAHYRAVGTYDPQTNRITEVPDEWLVTKWGWAIIGREGDYDPESGAIEGVPRTAETYPDWSPLCEDFQLLPIESSPGTELLAQYGFKAPRTNTGAPVALPFGTTEWAGAFSCGGTTFELELELDNTVAGILGATFRYWEAGATPEYAFELRGTHNDDTGNTLSRPGWTDWGNTAAAVSDVLR